MEGYRRGRRGRRSRGRNDGQRMDERSRRARNYSEQQLTQCPWQRLFVGASEWRCGPNAARPSEAPDPQAAKGRSRPAQRSRRSRFPVNCSSGKDHVGRQPSRQLGGFCRDRAALRAYDENLSESGVGGCRWQEKLPRGRDSDRRW